MQRNTNPNSQSKYTWINPHCTNINCKT
jgi:hypothetical protein